MVLQVNDESAALETVVLGIGTGRGKPRMINPVIRHHVEEGTYPGDQVVQEQLAGFAEVLRSQGIQVLSPDNLSETEQIFTRDLAFVIGDKLFKSNMKKRERQGEIAGLERILSQIDSEKQITLPEGVFLEGGDVILYGDYVFVGISDRSNQEGVDFLSKVLPEKTVIGLDLVVTDDPCTNILHLDCTFQPIGEEEAIFFEDGFAAKPEAILDLYPEEKLIRVNREQTNRMCPNVFSIAPDKVVIESNFKGLKEDLLKRGYTVFEVEYAEIAKLGGLLRCSTLPLKRAN